MTVYVEQSTPFEATFESGQTGLVGTVEVAIQDADGATITGPTTANITEEVIGGSPTGVYSWNAPAAPAALGQYVIVWSPDGSFDPITASAEDLVVLTQSATPLPPIPPPAEGGLTPGPCTAWVTADEVAACCSVESASDTSIFDDVADQASQLLYELSGRKYAGLCSKEGVRPSCDSCYCGYQVLSRGHVIGPWDYGYPALYCDQCLISCAPSRVKLSGYPVREITEVKIDGDVLDSSLYTLWNNRYLTRLNDGRWPVRQDLTLADTEEGTFSVSYTYGMSPPLMGAQAAAELACELYRACLGETCALPKGTTRVTRQGVTIEKLAFTSWGYTPARYARGGRRPGWTTGMPMVDAFLAAYNASGLMRRPVFFAPGKRQYAQEMG